MCRYICLSKCPAANLTHEGGGLTPTKGYRGPAQKANQVSIKVVKPHYADNRLGNPTEQPSEAGHHHAYTNVNGDNACARPFCMPSAHPSCNLMSTQAKHVNVTTRSTNLVNIAAAPVRGQQLANVEVLYVQEALTARMVHLCVGVYVGRRGGGVADRDTAAEQVLRQGHKQPRCRRSRSHCSSSSSSSNAINGAPTVHGASDTVCMPHGEPKLETTATAVQQHVAQMHPRPRSHSPTAHLKEPCTVTVQALPGYDGCTPGVLWQPASNI